jgi:hypothetical protein
MAIGVSAWFDPESEQRIREIWRCLHEQGINSTLHLGPYRPHITFGINDYLDVNKFVPELSTELKNLDPLPFILPSIGIFNEPLAGFLNVTVTPQLLSIHSIIQRVMAAHGAGPVPYYLPGRWNPHCTLAPDLVKEKLPGLAEFAAGLLLPIEGVIDRVGVIDTPAEIELHEVKLR